MGLMPRWGAGIWAGLPAVGAGAALSLTAAGLAGCASPGLPKPPSLQLPALVDDLAATRRGGAVELRFTLPSRSTDKFPLRSATVSAKLCRALDAGSCQPLAGVAARAFATPVAGVVALGELRDVLPAVLADGAPHLLTYRVELANNRGRSAGFSQPAFAASGAAPPVVAELAAQGSRLGTVLTWTSDGQAGERVVLRRELVQDAAAPQPGQGAAAHARTGGTGGTTPLQSFTGHLGSQPRAKKLAEPGVVLLDAHGGEASGSRSDATLDTTAAIDARYLYSAERRREVQVGGRALEIRSEASPQVSFTLRDVFPPPAPAELSAAGFRTPAAGNAAETFAVDLIWQPVDDPHLLGYNVYREALDGSGASLGAEAKLNAALVTMPSFHDAGANAQGKYRYVVTAVDSKGNESPAAITVLEPR